jgi:cytochrome c oxidase subunit 4
MAVSSHAAQSTSTHHGPSYMAVFWWLAILTVVELGVIFLPIGKVAIGVLLVALALGKAALVALYFMHLRFETRTLGLIALTPLVIGALLLVVLMPDTVGVGRATDSSTKIEAPKH